jgi:hypothetical protein
MSHKEGEIGRWGDRVLWEGIFLLIIKLSVVPFY